MLFVPETIVPSINRTSLYVTLFTFLQAEGGSHQSIRRSQSQGKGYFISNVRNCNHHYHLDIDISEHKDSS